MVCNFGFCAVVAPRKMAGAGDTKDSSHEVRVARVRDVANLENLKPRPRRSFKTKFQQAKDHARFHGATGRSATEAQCRGRLRAHSPSSWRTRGDRVVLGCHA